MPDTKLAAEPLPTEKIGDKVTVRGLVSELLEDGTVRVEIPTGGGGSIGVPVTPKVPAAVGEWIGLEVTVSDPKADTLTVDVALPAGKQSVDLLRAVATITPAPVVP